MHLIHDVAYKLLQKVCCSQLTSVMNSLANAWLPSLPSFLDNFEKLKMLQFTFKWRLVNNATDAVG